MEIRIPALLRIKPRALYKLGKYLREEGLEKIALFFGTGMKELLGTTVDISLEAAGIHVLLEKEVGTIAVDEVFRTTFAVPRGVSALVAIGGGMVIDYAKYIGFVSHLPILSVPTSISNDGFASPMASLYVDGKRRSLRAAMPHGVIIDTEVVQAAPARFILSGLGDLLSKYTAVRDWKDSFRATGEYVNDFAVTLGLSAADAVVHHPRPSLENGEFVRTLAQSLMTSGVTMEIAGSSRPASGGEHLISHAYEQLAKTPSLHGIQVALGSLCTLFLQESPRADELRAFMETTGLLPWVREHPLERAAFLEAIRIAPSVKEGFFTCLSNEAKRERLREWVQRDVLWKELLA